MNGFFSLKSLFMALETGIVEWEVKFIRGASPELPVWRASNYYCWRFEYKEIQRTGLACESIFDALKSLGPTNTLMQTRRKKKYHLIKLKKKKVSLFTTRSTTAVANSICFLLPSLKQKHVLATEKKENRICIASVLF